MTTEEHHPSPFNIGEDEVTLLQQLVKGQWEMIELLGKVIEAQDDTGSATDALGGVLEAFFADWKASNTAPAIPTQVHLVPGVPVPNQPEGESP